MYVRTTVLWLYERCPRKAPRDSRPAPAWRQREVAHYHQRESIGMLSTYEVREGEHRAERLVASSGAQAAALAEDQEAAAWLRLCLYYEYCADSI